MFTGTLTKAQLEPANKLCARKKLLLAFPQGTGKSVISIAAAEKLLELNYIKNVTILCPTSIGWQWEDRIKEFTDHEDVRLVEAKNKASRIYDTNKSLYTIIPYSVFRRDFRNINPRHIDLLIADEAQEFSNFRAKTFKLIKKYKTEYRWALTGTAISNKLEELYAIMQWVDPYFLPYWKEFEKRHLVRNPNTKQIIKYKNLESLHEYLLSKRVVRKSIDELKGSLPELLSYKIYVEKDKEVKESETHLLNSLCNSSATNSSNYNLSFDKDISVALHEARKALNSKTKLTKAANLIQSIMDESDSNRIVLFSFYKEPLYKLADELKQRGVITTIFSGDQSAREKQEATKEFKERTRVLLCSNAGSTGLDLPFANYTIHLDVPFSFGTMDQRSKRTQRISSNFAAIINIFLLVRDSIEDYYYQITFNKGKLAKATLEGGTSSVQMRPSTLKKFLEECS